MINEKKTGMSDEQKLLPQLIYRINSILSEIKLDLEKKCNEELFLALSVLEPHTRTFNWLVVNNDRWKFSNTEERKDVENHIKSNWEKLEKEFTNRIEMKTVSDAVNIVKNSIHVTDQEYHHALLSIYQFYPNNPRKYIDGIIYRNLMRRADEKKAISDSFKIDFAIADLLIKITGTYKLYPWARVCFYNNGKRDETKFSCQENNRPYYPESPNDPDVGLTSQIKNVKTEDYYQNTYPTKYKNRPTPATVRNDHFQKNYLLPFFADYDDFDPKEFLVLSSKHFTKFQYIYIIPVYDALYGEYGNLCAVLQIPFEDANKRNNFITYFTEASKKRNILIDRLPSLVDEIKNAAFFEILQQPIEDPHNLLDHYLKWLTILQDWERIMVWDKKEGKVNYCYTRNKNSDNDGNEGWNKCKDGFFIEIDKQNKRCKLCNQDNRDFEKLKSWILKERDKNSTIDEETFVVENSNHRILLEIISIFDRKLISDLYPEDDDRYKNIQLIYEYPSYTIFPDNKQKLGSFYMRQQIDLLRQVALKRRERREIIRHGTRAAVAAIMTRNLSHNIGSHVLTRLSTEEEICNVINKDRTIAQFLSYSRTRMDYLADISTGTQLASVSLNIYKDIIGHLRPSNIGCDEKFFSGQKLLLSKICESHNLNFEKIIIRLFKDDLEINWNMMKCCIDPQVAISNGLIGVHAIYSIIENVLRNSAKHGYMGNNNLEIIMKIETANENKWQGYEKLCRVTIWDKLGTCVKKNYEDREESLDEYINRKINTEIIDQETGYLQRGFWGIKEMKISAAYLRKIPMEDVDIKHNPPLIKAVKLDGREEKINSIKSSLGYTFYLPRPKELLIIDKDCNNKFTEERKNVLMLTGVYFSDSLINSIQAGVDHDFIIIKDNLADVLKQLDNLPIRLILVSDDLKDVENFKNIKFICLKQTEYESICSELNNENEQSKVMIKLWEKWFNVLAGQSRYQLLVSDLVSGDWSVDNFASSISNVEMAKKKISENNLNKYVVFDRHGDILNSIMQNENITFYEPYEQHEPIYPFVYFPPNDNLIKKKMVFEMLEAGVAKILIVDERIQEQLGKNRTFGKGNTKKRLKIDEMFKKMNIYVLPYNIDLKNPNKDIITDWVIKEQNSIITFLIIHQGIIDKMDELNKKEKAEEWIETIKNHVPYIIINSGRGKPPNIAGNTRFGHLSGILKYTIETKSKLHLLKLLLSLRST